MAVATGELMTFVDSDDWIAPDMYEHLYQRLEEDGSDIAACGVQMVWENKTPSRMLTREGNRVLNQEEAMRAIIEESWLKQPVWYKLYKTALVRDILFPKGKCHEDVFWSYQAVGSAKKVSVSDHVGYYYLQRGGSIMGAGYSLKRLDAVEAKVQRCTYIQERFPALSPLAVKDLWITCIYQGQLAMRTLGKAEAEKILAYFENVIGTHPFQMEGCSAKERLWLNMAKSSLVAACRVRNALKIGL